MSSEELKGKNFASLLKFGSAKEQFGNIPSRPDLTNFLIGMAFVGYGGYNIWGGMDDHRTRIDDGVARRVVLDGLTQLIKIAEKENISFRTMSLDQSRLVNAFESVLSGASLLQESLGLPEEILEAAEDWAEANWGERWESRLEDYRIAKKRAPLYGIKKEIRNVEHEAWFGNHFYEMWKSSGVVDEAAWETLADLINFRKQYERPIRLREKIRKLLL